MERKYCFVCGGEISEVKGRSWWCEHCQHRFYDNPRPTADVVLVTDDSKVLVVKRAFEPKKGFWNLPGGFVDSDETIEAAIVREIDEELGLSSKDFTLPTFVTSYPSRYEWGIENYHLICFIFVAKLKKGASFSSNDDVAEAKLATLEELKDLEFSNPNELPLILQAVTKIKTSK